MLEHLLASQLAQARQAELARQAEHQRKRSLPARRHRSRALHRIGGLLMAAGHSLRERHAPLSDVAYREAYRVG